MNEFKEVKKMESEEILSTAAIDDIWYNLTPVTDIIGGIIKYRKPSGQNILEIYVNGSNDTQISGSINFGRLPIELRPTDWGMIYGIMNISVNGENITKIQILNIGTDGRVVLSGGYSGSYVIKNYMFYGVIDL